ncbi:MAG: B12-binding domain-containing radical SAM protein [Planctomycetota bacterium]
MRRRRLLLVNPFDPGRSGYAKARNFSYPPLSLEMLAGMTPNDWDVELVDEKWEPFTAREADLVAVTAFTNGANRAYEIAAGYRKEGVPVVMGGVHASTCPEEALRFVDSVVIGEAESVWTQVLEDCLRGRMQPTYQGPPANLVGLPHPRRDLSDARMSTAVVQTSRGCPMDCDFCTVAALNGRNYRRRPVEEVLDELATIRKRRVFFADDNLVGYSPRDRQAALELFQGMVARRFRFEWGCQASVNIGEDEELLEWASRAKCRLVFIGFESDDSEALAAINKPLNLRHSAEHYAPLVRRIHRAGIVVMGSFIFGLDSETPEKLRHRVESLLAGNVDIVQVTVLTPFPGTRLFQRLQQQERLLCDDFPRDWDYYDGNHLVHQPLHVRPAELRAIVGELSDRNSRVSTCVAKAAMTMRESSKLVPTGMTLWGNWSLRPVRRALAEARKLPWPSESREVAVPS